MPLWRRRRRYRAGIDAVVVNYRTPDDLVGFVESFAAEELDGGVRLVLANVDPRPQDLAAADVALALARPGLEIEHLVFPDNVGYARACNAGLKGGEREVVALFNADTRSAHGAVQMCVDALLANPTWGALGPRQIDQEGRVTAGGIFGTNEAPKHRGWHQKDEGQFSDVRDDAVTVAGSAYFMRRAVWEQLTSCALYRTTAPEAEGAFLPTRLFYEETFCSYHARAHGYRNVYYGPALMIHFWHGSIDANGAPAGELFDESRAFFRRACQDHQIPCD